MRSTVTKPMSQSEPPGHLAPERSLHLAQILYGFGAKATVLPHELAAIGTHIVTMRGGLRGGIHLNVATGRCEKPAKYTAFVKLSRAHL